MKKYSGQLVYSPSDLVRYLKSPFASWMDRYYLENPSAVIPDEETEDERLIAQTGNQHERAVLDELRLSHADLVEVPKHDLVVARTTTLSAINAKASIIYQAALESGPFAGFADFLMYDTAGRYQVWVSLNGDVLPKDEVRGGVLGIVAKGLAFLRAVDATETDAFRALVVQDFESVAVKDSDDGAGEVGGESRDRP